VSGRRVSSRELGLVATEKLLEAEDLHYGYWDDRLELKAQNIRDAQEHYTDFLLSYLPGPTTDGRPTTVLDIGCGTGSTLLRLLRQGYAADGLCPSEPLCQRVREKQELVPDRPSKLFECRFEDLDEEETQGRYDVALFSESFQYIPMPDAFAKLSRLLRPGGSVVLCDFFRTLHDGDGGPGDRSFGGGHHLKDFYPLVEELPFEIDVDKDITAQITPNLELLNDILVNRVLPVLEMSGRYLEGRNPWIYRSVRWLARRKLDRVQFKYFSGFRSPETFERYKTYRLITLRYQPT
jgi:SAM-dependent methyltransferase